MTNRTIPNLSMLLGLCIALAGCAGPHEAPVAKPEPTAFDHGQEIRDWRESRSESLQRPTGWLSLVGLHWLQPGENRVGSAADNDIVLYGGAAHWGTIYLNGDEIRFTPVADADVTAAGQPLATSVPLVPDSQGEVTVVSSGTTQFYVIDRGSFALRVKDSEAPSRLNFTGLEYFPITPKWRIEAHFEPAEAGETIPIGNVLGQLNDNPKYGTAVFTLGERTYRLAAVGDQDSKSLFFIFADKTNGRQTYGAGRFMYTGLPENGKIILDFNKSYNPPCVFNEYSTCPLPPPENRVAEAILAGEKMYYGPGHQVDWQTH